MIRVRFILFYYELAPTDPWCNMLQTLLGQNKYKEEMSDKKFVSVKLKIEVSQEVLQ